MKKSSRSTSGLDDDGSERGRSDLGLDERSVVRVVSDVTTYAPPGTY